MLAGVIVADVLVLGCVLIGLRYYVSLGWFIVLFAVRGGFGLLEFAGEFPVGVVVLVALTCLVCCAD